MDEVRATSAKRLGDLHDLIQIFNELQEPTISTESVVSRDDLVE
jgi:hypothetical protein